jgi:hypothetical protein
MTVMTDPSFKEKIRSISFGAPRRPRVAVSDNVKHVELINETSGKLAGWESYKPDGTWDCTMRPEPVQFTSNKES